MKKFNLAGVCIPESHYMVDLTEKTDRIISRYIDQGSYFTINKAYHMFQKSVANRLLQIKVEPSLLKKWTDMPQDHPTAVNHDFDILGEKITNLCSDTGKGVVLMIDEVDKCSDNQAFLNFLGLLRSKYLDMQKHLDQSF